MEAKDAWLLLAGTVLGFVASLLATFAAPPVGSAFGKLRSGFIEQNKARALASYTLVRDLKSGKRDKYLFTLIQWGLALAFLLLFVSTFTSFVLDHSWYTWPFGVLALIAAIVFMNRMSRVILTIDRLTNFEDCHAALLRRWPDIELSK